MSLTRVLVIGIDAASPDLLLEWSADGTLPNLARLMGKGRTGRTQGLDGFFIGSTWPSIYTGVTPARHGFHYLAQLKPGSYDYYYPADRGMFDCPPFWSVLSQAGRRVAILDAPLSPLDASLNGIQILEWGGHDAVYGFMTQPTELAASIRSRFGDHPVGTSCDGARKTATDYEAFVDALIGGVQTKSEITRSLLAEGEWDLFMQVFSEAHCVGHQGWHLHDASHPAHDASISAALGDPIRRVYQAIDTAVGQVIDVAGDCLTFVFASHGMSHWYGAQFLLPEILFKLGVAQPLQSPARSLDPVSLLLAIARWSWHRFPDPMRERLGGLREQYGPPIITNKNSLPSIDVDIARSLCFNHRHGVAIGGIRLNLSGREPMGILHPGREADEFCHSLIDDLLAIVDERTGMPLIRRVLRVSDLYDGPRLGDLPDLLVEYSDAIPTGSINIGKGKAATVRIRSDKIGMIKGTNQYTRTGEHRSEGLLIAAGANVHPGAFARPVSVLDLAPTWTRLLGVRMDQAEGTPIEGLEAVV